MAGNADTVQKIIDLKAQVDGDLLKKYEETKAWIDNANKQIEELSKLPKMNVSQYKQLQAIQDLLPQVQDVAKQLQKPAAAAEKAQASVDELLRQLQSRLPNMGQQTAQNYESLKTGAFVNNDPQAQADFKRFVGNLSTVHSENLNKDLRKWVQSQIKAGVQVTTQAFAEQQNKLAQGETVEPDENPQLKRQLDAAKATGLRRMGMNFRDHMTSGAYADMGYAALALGQSGVGVADTYLDGRRYTQEARQRAMYGMLPGGLGILGAGVGAFTPLGPAGGALIGGAIGTGMEGYLSAKSERNETLRLVGEDLSQQMGKGVGATKSFVDALEDAARKAGTPVAELAEHVRTASRVVGTLTPGGITAMTGYQQQLGDIFPQAFGAALQFSQSAPLNQPYRDLVRTGNGDRRLFYGAALYEAAQGNVDGAYSQAELFGTSTLSPRAAQLQAQINADKAQRDDPDINPVARWGRQMANSKVNQDIAARQKELDALNASGGGTVMAPGPVKDMIDNLTRQTLLSRGLSQGYSQQAGIYGQYGQQQMMLGMGLKGLEPNERLQVSSLEQSQGALRQQEAAYVKAFSTAPAGAQGPLNALLRDVRQQLADVRGQIVAAKVGLFQEGVAEEGARFQGGYSRLGIGGDELTLGGASVFDPRVRRNLAQRRSFLLGQSAYDLGLASDMTNFLSPMEREQRRTSAKQEKFEADFVLPNQNQLARIGETQARSGERQANLRGDVARAQVAGGALATLVAENRLIDDQKRLRDELNTRLKEGHLTTLQQLQVTTQIHDLDNQILTGRKAAFDTAVQTFSDTAAARANIGATKSARETYLRGTSETSYSLAAGGYQSAMQHVAILKFAADTETNPDRKAQKQDAYQSALFGAEQSHIEQASTVSMGPRFDTAYTVASHELSRQMKSAFEPGSVLGSNMVLARMDQQRDAAISAQMRRIQSDRSYSPDERAKALAGLTEQQQSVRDDIFDRQQTVSLGWVDRLTAMSVNAPSFSARLMPGADRIANIAEIRGLGPMSARLFGYNRQASYRGAMAMGYMPSETNGSVYGNRPGDWPIGMGPNAHALMPSSADPGPYGAAGASGAGAMTLDTIDAGSTGAGMGLQAAQILLQAAQLIMHAAQTPQQVHINQINPTTGETATHVSNSSNIYDAKSIMRGGAGNPIPSHSRY